MTLRLKTAFYLLAIHLVFGTAAVWFLRHDRIWLLGLEVVFLVSLIAGFRVFRGVFGPLDLIRTGIQFIKESDFSTRFHETGQKEMDELVEVYNRMIDRLREERIRVREQHYFLEEIIKASPSGILTCDFDERIAMANPAAERILQKTSSELKGKRLQEIAGPFTAALAALQEGRPEIIPLQGIRRVKCQKSHFLDRGFTRNFYMVEELTEELRRSERAAYEKIIRMMSHEINNSIGASNSLLQSCLNYKDQLRPEDQDDFEMALNVAISRTHHLNAFMRSYADVIRLPKPEMRTCNVLQLLEEIALLMRPECKRREIAWKWDLQDELGPVVMDKNQMEQVFVNILRNAVEAIGEKGTITIRTGKQGGSGFVILEDTGHGIPPEVRAKLFTPFFSTKENGRGIGLTMIQEILIQHHFRFSLEGQAGQPTQFTIYF